MVFLQTPALHYGKSKRLNTKVHFIQGRSFSLGTRVSDRGVQRVRLQNESGLGALKAASYGSYKVHRGREAGVAHVGVTPGSALA